MGQGIISRSNPGNSGDKVGDIRITTRNTLGEKWALCNGEDAPEGSNYGTFDILDESYWSQDTDLYNSIVNAFGQHDEGTNVTIYDGIYDNNGNWYFLLSGTVAVADSYLVVKYNCITKEITSCNDYIYGGYTYHLCKDIYDNNIWLLKVTGDYTSDVNMDTKCLSDTSLPDRQTYLSTGMLNTYDTNFVCNGYAIYSDIGGLTITTQGPYNFSISYATNWSIIPGKDSYYVIVYNGSLTFIMALDKSINNYTVVFEISSNRSYSESCYDIETNRIILINPCYDTGLSGIYERYILIVDCDTWKVVDTIEDTSGVSIKGFININNCSYIITKAEGENYSARLCSISQYINQTFGQQICSGAVVNVLDKYYTYTGSNINEMRYIVSGSFTVFVASSKMTLPTISVDDESYCFIKIKD